MVLFFPTDRKKHLEALEQLLSKKEYRALQHLQVNYFKVPADKITTLLRHCTLDIDSPIAKNLLYFKEVLS